MEHRLPTNNVNNNAYKVFNFIFLQFFRETSCEILGIKLTTKAEPNVNRINIKGITIPFITPYILNDL